MATYNPLDSRFLTTANAITRDGQKFVRIILDIQDNVFYTLDDDGNFNPIGSGGTSSSGVTSINVGAGLSANTSTGAVNIVNTAPNQSVSISGGTDIEVTGSYPNFGINFTGTTSGVTGSGVVNTLNDVYYFPLWTATTPTASAVTTTQLTTSGLRYIPGLGIATGEGVYLQGSTTIGSAIDNYTLPAGGGTAFQILGYNNDPTPTLVWQNINTILPENLYGNVNGATYTFTGLTTNTWDLYEGTWTRIITNGISVSSNPPAISINDPLYNGHILMFNVTGEINATANHAVEIAWSYNDVTPTIIAGSNQVAHLRSGVPVGNFNQNFLAEISQGSNDFYLFARNITDSTNITLTNINVVITTIYSPNA